MKCRIVLAMVFLLAPAGLQASPIQIVDTGPGPANSAGFLLDSTQWLAVEFDVADTAVITDVQAWMQVVTGGNLDLALYEGGSAVPGTLLFRSTGFIESGNSPEWRGLSALGWSVAPGTYWVGFEAPGPNAIVATLPFPSERPLHNGAEENPEILSAYGPLPGVAQVGLRVGGDVTPSPTPEPASILLLATGLAGLIARPRRASRRS